MLRRLFAPRKSPTGNGRPFVRLQLEALEKREVLDASATSALNYLAYSAHQTAQQIQQLQTTTQNDLTHFQQDSAAYTSGNGNVSLTQINQDIAGLKQDASSIQALSATFQKDGEYFFLGLLSNLGSFSSQDGGPILYDLYTLKMSQALVASADQLATGAASVTPPPPPSGTPPATSGSSLVTLTLNPLNVNLLGLQLQTNQIQVTISGQTGQGDLLGNVLGDTANLLNLPAVNNAINNVLANTVSLLNSGSLSVAGISTDSGPLTTGPSGGTGSDTASATTSVLTLHVAPVQLNLLGAVVTTSPIDLTLTAQPGQGLVLGNALSDLANLFNPPLPSNLTIDDINTQLNNLLNELNQQIPNVGGPPPTSPPLGNGQFLNLTVAPINLNLLGLNLQTSQIQVNATNQTGNGDLLGNVTSSLLNTLGANPQNLGTLNGDLNAILGKVIGVLNASTLTLPPGAVNALPAPIQQLANPNLITSSGSATAPILNLAIASANSSTPPVDVNLLGLDITTSDIQAQLVATTGQNQILGNLLYNVANLLNPGSPPALLGILNELGL